MGLGNIQTSTIALILILPLWAAFTSTARSDEGIEQRGPEINLGPWAITAHQTNVSHEFSHCTASTTYTAASSKQRNQMRGRWLGLMVKIMRNGGARFDLGGDNWKFTAEKKYEIEFLFDTGQSFHINGASTLPAFLSAEFKIDADWYKAMMQAHAVELFIAGKSIGAYKLNDSSRALTQLYSCAVANMKQDNVGTFDDNGTALGEQSVPSPVGDTF